MKIPTGQVHFEIKRTNGIKTIILDRNYELKQCIRKTFLDHQSIKFWKEKINNLKGLSLQVGQANKSMGKKQTFSLFTMEIEEEREKQRGRKNKRNRKKERSRVRQREIEEMRIKKRNEREKERVGKTDRQRERERE